MNAPILYYYSDAQALDLFDELAGNRTPEQAVAIVRALQSGDALAVFHCLTAMKAAAEHVEADLEDAVRDEANARCDVLYDALKDSLLSVLQVQAA